MVTPLEYAPITMLPQQQQHQQPIGGFYSNINDEVMKIMHRQQQLLFGNYDIRLEQQWNRTKKLAFSDKVDCFHYSRDETYSNDNLTITTQSLEVAGKENDINNNDDVHEDNINNMWWKKEELDMFKESAKNLARELRRKEKESGSKSVICSSLLMAQKKTTIMMNSDFKLLLKLPLSRPDEDLYEWCKHNDGRRGLERFICTQDAIRQRNGVIRTRRAVLATQKKKRVADRISTYASNCFEEEIAESSRQVTRRSRTLAHFIGAADARVANNAYYPQRKRARTSITRSTVVQSNIISTNKKSQHHHVVATATTDQQPQRRQAHSCAA